MGKLKIKPIEEIQALLEDAYVHPEEERKWKLLEAALGMECPQEKVRPSRCIEALRVKVHRGKLAVRKTQRLCVRNAQEEIVGPAPKGAPVFKDGEAAVVPPVGVAT